MKEEYNYQFTDSFNHQIIKLSNHQIDYMISKYLLYSQSVTAFKCCLHSHSRVCTKCSVNFSPRISFATGDFFIICVASSSVFGKTPYENSLYPFPFTAACDSFSFLRIPYKPDANEAAIAR